jgi:hypothetical protein
VNTRSPTIGAIIAITAFSLPAFGQETALTGQASLWIASVPTQAPLSHLGIHYTPDLTLGQSLGPDLNADVDLSLHVYGTRVFARHAAPQDDGKLSLYRAWVRLSSNVFELRLGLQKISFGSATLFRPLMWFDTVDPRDPLQLTDGVSGLLARYYFLNNTNIWAWALYGNPRTKGWEILPTARRTPEVGFRAQFSLLTGELGATYHHRRADLAGASPRAVTSSTIAVATMAPGTISEDRFAVDGKWNAIIGCWFEVALTHDQTQVPDLEFTRQGTLGADYTFAIGNGLTVLSEFFRSDNPRTALGSAEGFSISGLSLAYPLDVVDKLSLILFLDWTSHDWYRIATWQQSYDQWSIYLVGFWNPTIARLYQLRGGSSPYAGSGLQLMIVFNH